jgi:hypothetical protein
MSLPPAHGWCFESEARIICYLGDILHCVADLAPRFARYSAFFPALFGGICRRHAEFDGIAGRLSRHDDPFARSPIA